MTAVHATAPTRIGRLATVLVATVASFLAVFLGTTFGATPAHSATAPCAPDDQTACVAVVVLDASNSPVTGATVMVEGEGFTQELQTAEGQPASATVPGAGTYVVTLDVDSLPDGVALAEEAATEFTIRAQTGSTTRVAFRLGESEASPAPTATGGAGGEETDDTVADGPGTAAEPRPDGSVTARQFWQQLGSGVRFGLLLALASVGLSLIYGTTRLSSFSHGEQVTLGAVSAFLFVNVLGLPLIVGALLTILVCGATGWAQDAGIWKPLRRRGTPVVQMMIVTIGLSIALQFLIQLFIGAGSVRILTTNPQSWTVGPFTLTRASWISMGIALVVLAAVAWFLTRTRIGQATRAVSDNPALASATGIDTDRIVRIVWILATALAGLGGMLYGLVFGTTNWMMGMQMLLLMFAAVTLGGLGTAFGALIGSMVIGLVVELSNLFLPSDLRYATALVILILVLLLRPQGLLGRRERIG
ncbi:branched-chain amino acid ABC transporter permease [Oerskovia flava]|uniref:branched-chain amino acid ABC transporter permease n=1 Tax=Oerskovia flava TaxID=2986422 RepID=UPI002240BA60|nr:branched-chain amino acid ABC transporter permease [Oerskovia sp. JB1-3-2]